MKSQTCTPKPSKKTIATVQSITISNYEYLISELTDAFKYAFSDSQVKDPANRRISTSNIQDYCHLIRLLANSKDRVRGLEINIDAKDAEINDLKNTVAKLAKRMIG